MFMKEQDYEIKNTLLYQDNQRTIRILADGRNSCKGNSRHINVRYFFVQDRIDKREVRVEYCPTHSMSADYYSNPL